MLYYDHILFNSQSDQLSKKLNQILINSNVYYYHSCFYIEVNTTNDMNYTSTEKNI